VVLLYQKARAGELGKKMKRGFMEWTA